jgi:hypothetical protein
VLAEAARAHEPDLVAARLAFAGRRTWQVGAILAVHPT